MTETRSVIMEREFPYPPEKVWYALTQPHLIEEWLMKNNFRPQLGQSFELHGDWGSVSCKVLEIEPSRTLVYSWAANGLESIVTWTLAPSAAGTSLRVEQSGFRTDQEQPYQGVKAGWPRFLVSFGHAAAQAARLAGFRARLGCGEVEAVIPVLVDAAGADATSFQKCSSIPRDSPPLLFVTD